MPDVKVEESNSKIRTKICDEFLRTGQCSRKEDCSYAHSNEELRGHSKFRIELYKTQMCSRYSAEGKCLNGSKCPFAHERHELRPFGMSNSEFEKKISENNLYKTQPCKEFYKVGFCKVGKDCSFAHGDNELRTIAPQHIKRKRNIDPNAICKQFLNSGHCPLGDLCQMRHVMEDNLGSRSALPPMQNYLSGMSSGLSQASLATGSSSLKRSFESPVQTTSLSPPPSDAIMSYEDFLIEESNNPALEPPPSYKRYLAYLGSIATKRVLARMESKLLAQISQGPPSSKKMHFPDTLLDDKVTPGYY